MGSSLYWLIAVVVLSVSASGVSSEDAQVDSIIIDGVDVTKLSEPELYAFSKAEDDKFSAELSLYVGRKYLEEKYGTDFTGKRTKRALPLLAPIAARAAWMAGRHLLKSLSRSKPKLSPDGKLKQYFKRGNYNKAVRDFNRFRPTNVKTSVTRNGKYRGMRVKTGNIGNTRITVRSSNSSGRPTLELRTGNKVRKIRYDSRKSLRRRNRN